MRTHGSRYLRVAALGDSTTYGIGDPVPGGWRGWARLLADALGEGYDVSFCNTAVSGATVADVLTRQLEDAVAHRPDLASVVVGINDTMKSSWDPARMRADLTEVAERLTGAGALLLTTRFHDHGEVFGLPGRLRRVLWSRIEAVNELYDDLHATYGGLRVDLALHPEINTRACWSVDRLHPSERGHRVLAGAFAEELALAGYDVGALDVELRDGLPPTWRREVAWVLTEGGPWIGRRARDLGPVLAQHVLAPKQRVAQCDEDARVEQRPEGAVL